jgi:Peptidase propeptide and YPEB domain
MKASTTLILATALLGTLGVAGVVHLVNAAQPQTPIAIPSEHPSGNQISRAGDDDSKNNAKEKVEDQRESAKLKALAKLTPQQAQKAAEVAQGGKSSRVKLESEDGNLVYTVVIGQKEVKVDAGNGRVLYTEGLNQEDEKAETSHPRSSIQVSEALGGDGDGETNDDG